MSELFSAVRWDWFALARRWIPWILLAVLLLLSQLSLLAAFFGYQGLRNAGDPVVMAPQPFGEPVAVHCRDIAGGDARSLPPSIPPQFFPALQSQCVQEQAQYQRELSDLYQTISPAGSIVEALNVGLTVALVLLAILVASHLGSEYGWGTVRTNLVRGLERWRYLAARLILLAVLGVCALVALTALTALDSLIAIHFATPPSAVAAANWSHPLALLGRACVALIPYLLLTAFVTLLTRSSAAGMAIAIGYYLAEHVVVQIVGNISHRTQTVAHYLIGQNIDAWSGASFLGLGQASVSQRHALLMIAAYSLVLAAGSFLLFTRRDVGGAAG
jgi:ABC-2 type transport system permease protein